MFKQSFMKNFKMKKAKIKKTAIIILAWIIAIAMAYIVFLKAKLVLNNK